MNRDDTVFPFSAVVGIEQAKIALLLNAVSQEVGGVLIRGRRGTAKSTLARGLAHLLPEIEVVSDCPFSCDPHDIESLCGYCAGRLAVEGNLPSQFSRMKLVTLPLNATEDMVVGTIDITKALKEGEKCFEPGILARANRSILYIDEVNLLDDHIVDIILDSAAMGVNIVEREGISFRHSSRFILVGTMNPEEGELRPQLEDRFGLCVDLDEEISLDDRREILKRNLEFRKNPLEFESRWNEKQEALRKSITEARNRYGYVKVSEEVLELIAAAVQNSGAHGYRADIAILHSARALAALEGEDEVNPNHIERVAPLALSHRMQKSSLDLEKPEPSRVQKLVRELATVRSLMPEAKNSDTCSTTEEEIAAVKACAREDADMSTGQDKLSKPELPESKPSNSQGGKRGPEMTSGSRGRYYRSIPARGNLIHSGSDIAIDATIRSSAKRASATGSIEISEDDLKVKVRKRKVGASILFVVDASASMGAERRLASSKEAVLCLLEDAYAKRDRVGLVVFKDSSAKLVMSPTSSFALAKRLLSSLEPGGATPLSHGLALGLDVLSRELSRKPPPQCYLVLVSDGGGNVPLGSGNPLAEALTLARSIKEKGIHSLVIDSAPMRAPGVAISGKPTYAKRIADALGASYHPISNITSEAILDQVSGFNL